VKGGMKLDESAIFSKENTKASEMFSEPAMAPII
jgi:hypothetical protein